MRKKGIEVKDSENGCLLVVSHRLNGDGYCNVWHKGRMQRAHRLVYEECYGEIPDGLVVRHKCDTPSCINPEHLELGTQKENMNDRSLRGRSGSSKIDEEIARTIKIMLSNGLNPTEIARTLGIGRKVVRGINEQKTWKHIAI